MRLLTSIGLTCIAALLITQDATACTRILWNDNPDLIIVGRNEDYVTASHPTLVATPRGIKRYGTADPEKRSKTISWTVKYGNIAVYANNRFPNDGMNEAGLTARTLFYIQGEANEIVAPDTKKKELENAAKHKDAKAEELSISGAATDRFVRADFLLGGLPKPRKNDANTAYGFMYSVLGICAMPAGLPVPEEDKAVVEKITAALTDPNETYGSYTYWQTISDLTNKHYRLKSLLAPSDVYFNFDDYNFAKGQPVRLIKRIDRYAQQGWCGNVIPRLVEIKGDIYEQSIE